MGIFHYFAPLLDQISLCGDQENEGILKDMDYSFYFDPKLSVTIDLFSHCCFCILCKWT